MSAAEYFITKDGRQEIPGEVVCAGRNAVERFIAAMGWRPPTPVELAKQAAEEEAARKARQDEEEATLPKPEAATPSPVDPRIAAAIKQALTPTAVAAKEA